MVLYWRFYFAMIDCVLLFTNYFCWTNFHLDFADTFHNQPIQASFNRSLVGVDRSSEITRSPSQIWSSRLYARQWRFELSFNRVIIFPLYSSFLSLSYSLAERIIVELILNGSWNEGDCILKNVGIVINFILKLRRTTLLISHSRSTYLWFLFPCVFQFVNFKTLNRSYSETSNSSSIQYHKLLSAFYYNGIWFLNHCFAL